ncbi:PadR family transcriptional regulator [Tepidanaerobacter sp. GT38]|uniref:PadR family transcriptional regulator n=1 Tax=Tepidanaerobacter sp. GT38 TaxID=2722793 RepID=UPI001F30C99E|nr:PadR family transcriptional regulator [Tepidanaerobacter sp. GT38]MCG1013246.1 PadR family transcriptional regulator [Tepidanaerobacter sp. GT38]
MSISLAILGLLSYKPMSGYDLKKIIQDSSFMYWSGNNNQIYKALSELRDKGFVTNEVIHQDGAPTKKIYKITG